MWPTDRSLIKSFYASNKEHAHLDDDPALHLVPAVHVDPEHDGHGPGPDVEDVAAAGVGVQHPGHQADHQGAGAGDHEAQAGLQAPGQRDQEYGAGPVWDHDQVIRHRHVLKQNYVSGF